MRRETKIGLLALVTIAVIVVGYNFLKGQELFSNSNTYYIIYENVDQLSVGDGVSINGYRVGQVVTIQLNRENVRALTVGIRIADDLPLPKSTTALIKSDGLLGGRFIALEFAEACTGANCAEDGDFLLPAEESFLAGIIGDPDQVKEYVQVAKEAAGPLFDSLARRFDTSGLGRTLRNVEAGTENLASLTDKIDRLLARTSDNLTATTSSVAAITDNLARNNARIERILSNVDSTTSNLAAVDLAPTLENVNTALKQLQTTLDESGGAIENLNGITESINSGEGSLGMLIKKDDLHVQLERVTTNLDLLLQDFRLNPKRYVNVSVFGKRQKDYELPEDDPAEEIVPDRE